ncbi:putative integral membrane protein [Evansella cellulosilytica DSM 2522]|uniref:Putative integral membrane protein n=2 Tax=Evansella TaxID=2837485 RepID=E6TYX2_EVAC2|nr:putative integral membrane protein [Evansella cellulosilytica DSM 2522]
MKMSSGLRKFVLISHITLSVGWIGSVIAFIALDVAVITSNDSQLLRSSYLAMGLIYWWVLVPLAIGALVTGFAMSLGTKWGLFHHYWVIFKLVLTSLATVVLLSYSQTINYMVKVARDPVTSFDDISALGGSLVHSVGGLTVLLMIMILSVYKPRGMTRYGWNKQQELRQLSKQ